MMAPKVRTAANVEEWRRWWCIYTIIYTSEYPLAGPQMAAYENKIFAIKARYSNTFIWRNYDEEFRRQKAPNPKLFWHKTHDESMEIV